MDQVPKVLPRCKKPAAAKIMQVGKLLYSDREERAKLFEYRAQNKCS